MKSSSNYLSAPVPSKNIPKGIPYIIVNELAERFSFYGMKCILMIFMTQHLLDSSGNLDTMSDADATYWYHLFTSAVYFTPLLGAIICDRYLGKYKTILILSSVYCLGHLCLALDETRMGLAFGLTLIALGAGGIKSCVSAHVGDQFGKTNSHLLEKVFGWFYISINLGAFISTLLTPFLLKFYGPSIAFGIPGILMFIATIAFWMGRNVFIHIPPFSAKFFKDDLGLVKGIRSISKLFIIYLFVAMFWALFDQTGSTWIIQSQKLNRVWLGVEWLPSQIQAVNPIMILILTPIFSYFLYPSLNKFFALTPLRKILIGLFLAVPSFLIIAIVEMWIEQGLQPSIVWHIIAYAILTASEVLISITCLEFSYTQAPNHLKSLVMGFFMMSVAIGNIFTAWINKFIINLDGTTKLEGPAYFYFFAFMMLLSAIGFIFVERFYKSRTYFQKELT